MKTSPIRCYRDLKVWQDSIVLVVECYEMTREFPTHERFGLTSQLRRAAASIPANIAEGYSRGYRRDYIRFVAFARGSLAELETHAHIAFALGYIANASLPSFLEHTSALSRMLTGLHRSLTDGPVSQRHPGPSPLAP